MTKVFSRWLPCATLLTWSAILLYFYFSGRVTSYLHPTFRPFVLGTGCVMAALAACFVFLPGVASCCDEDQCGHPLGRMSIGRVLTFVILVLPISLAATISENQFGASTIANRGIITDANALAARAPARRLAPPNVEPPLPTKDGSQPQPQQPQAQQNSDAMDFIPRGKDGFPTVQVIDLLYAAQDTSLRADLENKTVEMIGQFMPDHVSNASGKRFKLMRMFMTCCAADARPIAALVEPAQKPEVAEMSWVKVVGKVAFPLENGRTIAVLKAEKVESTDPPEEAMLF